MGSASLLNTTLTGMPCGLAQTMQAMQPHEQQLLRRRYAGCQNLSTREWMAAQDDPPHSEDGQDEQDDDDDDEGDEEEDQDDDEQANRNRSENNA